MNGRKWKLFDEDSEGNILYPIHDACLTIMEKISHRNLQQAGPGAPFTTLRDYYQAMCRLNLRNTTYPYRESSEASEDWGASFLERYGAHGLEWEHECYGAMGFQTGPNWECEIGWEV